MSSIQRAKQRKSKRTFHHKCPICHHHIVDVYSFLCYFNTPDYTSEIFHKIYLKYGDYKGDGELYRPDIRYPLNNLEVANILKKDKIKLERAGFTYFWQKKNNKVAILKQEGDLCDKSTKGEQLNLFVENYNHNKRSEHIDLIKRSYE